MPRGLQLAGMKFNMLTVLLKTEVQLDGNVRWDCVCDCGNTTSVAGSRIMLGKTKSCGCLVSTVSILRQGRPIHGMSKTPEYRAWQDAKWRCYEPKDPQYSYYGGRGIVWQENWIDDFAAFFAHIGPRPSNKYSLDRIDNDLDYCEGNVRWATKREQVANRGMNKNNKTGVTGVTLVINPDNGFRHYKATWGPKGGLTRKSFSVTKYGEECAYQMAVKARLDGLEKLRAESVYTIKHGEERKSK